MKRKISDKEKNIREIIINAKGKVEHELEIDYFEDWPGHEVGYYFCDYNKDAGVSTPIEETPFLKGADAKDIPMDIVCRACNVYYCF